MNTAVVASVLLARHTTRSCRPRPAFLVPSFGSQKEKSTPARWGFSTNAADPYGIVRSASLDATGPDAWKSLSSRDCQRLLETASQAARAAGAVITAHLGCAAELEAGTTHHSSRAIDVKTNIKDIVTEYDKQAQLAVETIVRAAYPTHSFLGEEDVDPGAAASEAALSTTVQNSESGYVWICDPIDGTANFASGLRLCAVTMAVVYQGITVVGVVYDPHEDELFAAVRGQGATVNGQPLRVADTVTNVHDAIVNAGCPADPAAFATSAWRPGVERYLPWDPCGSLQCLDLVLDRGRPFGGTFRLRFVELGFGCRSLARTRGGWCRDGLGWIGISTVYP
jgi:fructose-1,6-bisphosphatase/inositol monophosphatase family enzyme